MPIVATSTGWGGLIGCATGRPGDGAAPPLAGGGADARAGATLAAGAGAGGAPGATGGAEQPTASHASARSRRPSELFISAPYSPNTRPYHHPRPRPRPDGSW